jgi:hypothetical protein
MMLALAASERMKLVVKVVVCKARSKHFPCLDITIKSFKWQWGMQYMFFCMV